MWPRGDSESLTREREDDKEAVFNQLRLVTEIVFYQASGASVKAK